MRRTALLVVPLAALVGVGYVVGTVHEPTRAAAAASDPAADGVIVSGLGKVSGTPDVLRVQLGVHLLAAVHHREEGTHPRLAAVEIAHEAG